VNSLKRIIRPLIYFLFFFDLLKIRRLKNKHLNEKVYIVADSAELRFFDFKRFDDIPMICFNFSWLINDVIERKSPLYAHMIEPFAFTSKSVLGLDTRNYLKKRINDNNVIFFTSLTNRFSFISERIYYLFRYIPFDKVTKNFMKVNRNFMLWSGLTAISIAIYMGFKEAYLIGFSTHSSSFEEHWYSKTLTKTNPLDHLRSDVAYNKQFHYLSEFIKLTSIGINEVEDSYFEYIKYSDYSGVLPVNNDNISMTDINFLKFVHSDNLYPKEIIL
jgi:hypothetical protein